MTEWVEQQACIKLCSKLHHSSAETVQMIQATQLWVTSDWELHHHNMPLLKHHISCRVFLVKHHITQVTQPLYSSDLAPCDFWLFPKLKSPLKGKKFQTVHEIQENMMGQLMVIGRTVWGPNVSTLKGPETSLSYVQCFLYLLQLMSLFVIAHGWILSGQTLCVPIPKVCIYGQSMMKSISTCLNLT